MLIEWFSIQRILKRKMWIGGEESFITNSVKILHVAIHIPMPATIGGRGAFFKRKPLEEGKSMLHIPGFVKRKTTYFSINSCFDFVFYAVYPRPSHFYFVLMRCHFNSIKLIQFNESFNCFQNFLSVSAESKFKLNS